MEGREESQGFEDEINNSSHWATNMWAEQKASSFSKKISAYENFQQDVCYLVDLKDRKGTCAIKSLLGISRYHRAAALLSCRRNYICHTNFFW